MYRIDYSNNHDVVQNNLNLEKWEMQGNSGSSIGDRASWKQDVSADGLTLFDADSDKSGLAAH